MPLELPTQHVARICNECNTRLWLPAIDESVFPLVIQCPKCGTKEKFAKPDQLLATIPKQDPGTCQGLWSINPGIQSIAPVQEKLPALPSLPYASVQDYSKASFPARTDYLAGMLETGFKIIESLHLDLEKLGHSMAQDFSTAWSKSQVPLQDTDFQGYVEFLSTPFTCMMVPESDIVVTEHGPESLVIPTYLALAPRFYKRPLGFPVESFRAGWYAYIINGASQITYPLDHWVREVLQLIPLLDLRVQWGDRLVGRSLYGMWAEIPGVHKDDDHTDQVPSIKMHCGHVTRPWLAMRGVNPYPPMMCDRLDFDETCPAYQALKTQSHYREAFERFCITGHMLLSWSDMEDAMSFCGAMLAASRGQAAILTSDDAQRLVWLKRSYRTILHPIPCMTWNSGRLNTWLKDIQLLVVDVSKEVNLELIQELHLYTGKLLLVSNDFLFDLSSSMEEFTAVFGVTGYCHLRHARVTASNEPIAKCVSQDKASTMFWDAVMNLRK